MSDKYDIQWVGHCTDDGSDKIWGWMFYKEPGDPKARPFSYTFWGAVGKVPQFKKFENETTKWGESVKWDMEDLVYKKKRRGYKEISVDELLRIFPNVFDKFEDKFIFNLIADGFK